MKGGKVIEMEIVQNGQSAISPAVRGDLYQVGLALIPILVVAGVVVGDQAQLWLTLVAAVLGIPVAGVAAAHKPVMGDE